MTADPLNALVPGWEPSADGRSAEGPLAGLTVVVKDVIDIGGAVTGGGSPDWAAAHEPGAGGASAVTALWTAGASLTAKGQCAELAFSLSGDNVHFGMPRNPAAPDRDPGGSTERPGRRRSRAASPSWVSAPTPRSIRVPASFCGGLGFRPDPRPDTGGGGMPLAQGFDTVGLLAASPRAAARRRLLLGIAAGSGSPPSRLAARVRPLWPPPNLKSPRPAARPRTIWAGSSAPSSPTPAAGRCALPRGWDGGLQRAAGRAGLGQLRGLGRADEPIPGG